MSADRDFAARVIREYDAQGSHRTGTEVDAACAEWLAALVREIGFVPELEAFSLERVVPGPAFVRVGGRKIDGLPLFDAAFTSERSVEGVLGEAGSDAPIGLVEVRPGGEAPDLELARRGYQHQLIIAVTKGNRPGLAPRNAWHFREPYGPPVLQVSSEQGEFLRKHLGEEVQAVATATRESTTALNVITVVPGRDESAEPVVVMTPRSGWWRCASERGGGIVCWLEALRALADANPVRDVVFLASSGHELGHLGLDDFLAEYADIADNAAAWVHFGASIGAAGGQLHLFTSNDRLEHLTVEAIGDCSCPLPRLVDHGTMPPGESRNIHERGQDYVSLIGGSDFFHLPDDRWPDAVDIDAVVCYAEALSKVVLALAEAGHPGAGTEDD
ncbi:MAG: hypothetical protein Kow0010_23330 [Dehalococcoidia bacterium]